MPGMRLEELIGRLRQGGLQPTAEDVADALWLARRLGTAASPASHDPTGTPAADGTAPGPDGAPGEERPAAPPGARDRSGQAPAAPPPAGLPAPSVPLHTPAPAALPGRTDGDGTATAFPVRAPAAGALPGLLGLQKALRALGRYRTAPVPGRDERIDETATAERAAASGILLPVTRPGRHRRCEVQLLMDTGPAMAVWGELVEELRQACQQSGAFASVHVHQLYADDSGTLLVGTTAGPGRHTRLRPAEELHDPSGRRLTFVVSDCVGPLWQSGAAQRLLHGWPRTAPLAVVQPLPPRLWGRTALPAEPGLLVRTGETGGRLDFLPEDEPWEEIPPGARPVPVLQPTPEAFEAFARLLAGTGPTREPAWAGFAHPGTAPAEHAVAPPPRSDDELLRAFRASASPGALRLAVYLAAAPLTLPVMRLVQRAMLPDTGPMELAEVLLGGLLRQLPGTDDQPCFAYPPRMQDLLLSSLDQDTAGLVLKHCSAYVERHFGKGTRNFAALAAARLADRAPAAGPLPEDEGTPYGGGVEAELFARVPARVLRFYLPDLVTPDPLAEAEHLLVRWRQLADPELLRRARDQVRAATAGTAPAGDPGRTARARLVLGRVLRAEAGTAGARAEGRRAGLLREAVAALATAYALASADSRDRAEAALELAAGRRELWHLTQDPDHLTEALRPLDPGTPPWPRVTARAHAWRNGPEGEPGAGQAVPGADTVEGGGDRAVPPAPAGPATRRARDVPWEVRAQRDRVLLRGRVLLELRQPAAAVPELREACALLAREGVSAAVRTPALLELVRALRGAGSEDAEIRRTLREALETAGDDPALRRPALVAMARFHDAAGEFAQADAAYEGAVLRAPADGLPRVGILTAWGESLLRRAATEDGGAVVDRAEYVLHEALAALPARSEHRGRLQGLVGSALAQRFRHLGFLPDLFESRHLLGQSVRTATDAAVRAEAWLQLARVRLEFWYRVGAPVPAEAVHAYDNAVREAEAAYGGESGSVTAARALHGRGVVLALMGSPGAAREAFRAAREQWQRLAGALREVEWADVELTRRAEREPPPARDRSLPERAWREAAPPWWPWSQDWLDTGGHDRS
ncbi:SAV_2336 N-terminal domain-related protein [Streptomyces sp. NPDC038707]|uniref:SAV_2336 N-terminal domain-related protein n=1 Tax=Streptomyces sp. NPDC038707 TaxID=3154329 RepID=UPI0033D5D277